MSAAFLAVSDDDSPEPGERVWWSSLLWTVTERDGALARIERVGTVGRFDLGVLWADVALLTVCDEQGQF